MFTFEQNPILKIDIDYIDDAKWGWVPNGWRITQVLDERVKRQVVGAKVTSYCINEPGRFEEFQIR